MFSINRATSSSTNFIQNGALNVGNGFENAYQQLIRNVAPNAFHDSGERIGTALCHRGTRVGILERLMGWAMGMEDHNSVIMWLHGSVGLGKTTIAQTIAEMCFEEGVLLASYFFSRSDPGRNSHESLIPTIAYQIASAIPEFKSHISTIIDRDPLIFTRSLQSQMRSLIAHPFQMMSSDFIAENPIFPSLVIIDAFDECQGGKYQHHILEAIASTIRKHHLPLKFLILSRPEPSMRTIFTSKLEIRELSTEICLEEVVSGDEDIQQYIKDSLDSLKEFHPLRHLISPSWPSSDDIQRVIGKSSGQFLYAATIVEYLKTSRSHPSDGLDDILSLRLPDSPHHYPPRNPFSALDEMYIHILTSINDIDTTLRVLGFIIHSDKHLDNSTSISHTLGFSIELIHDIESFFGLGLGSVHSLMSDLPSLIALVPFLQACAEDGHLVTGYVINILHPSFSDFLLDKWRSSKYYIDAVSIHTASALQCFTHIFEPIGINQVTFSYSLLNLTYHCLEALPTDLIKNHLIKLSFSAIWKNINDHCRKGILLRNGFFITDAFIPELLKCVKTLISGEHEDDNCVKAHLLSSYDEFIQSRLGTKYAAASEPRFSGLLAFTGVIDIDRFHSWDLYEKTALQHLFHFGEPSLISSLIDDLNDLTFIQEFNMLWTFSSLDQKRMLRAFLTDQKRAGICFLDGALYAKAALFCLEYVCNHQLHGLPPRYCSRDLDIRRNTPWKWRKLIRGGALSQRKQMQRRTAQLEWKLQTHISTLFPRFYVEWQDQRSRSRPFSLALSCLPGFLGNAGLSEELIHQASRKSFAIRSFKFPRRAQLVKDAIVLYLGMV